MNCLSWPTIFKGNSTIISNDYNASKICLHLLLSSEAGELFGDPDFGIKLKKYTFDQNNYILRDILIDEIYTKISIFCPQLILDRKNITIEAEGSKVFVHINCKNNKDFETYTFDLVLFQSEDGE